MLHFEPSSVPASSHLGSPSHASQHTSTTRSWWGAHWTAAKPFLPHSWEPWKPQTPFHGSPCFILSLPKPSPPHSWEQLKAAFDAEKKQMQMFFLEVPKFFVNFDEFFPCYVSTKMDKSLPVRQAHKSHVMCQKKTRLNRLPSPVSSAPTLYRNIAYHSEFNGAGCCGIKMVRVLEMEIPNWATISNLGCWALLFDIIWTLCFWDLILGREQVIWVPLWWFYTWCI